MTQARWKPHAKRQCNMILDQNEEEEPSTRVQYSPRDAKASKFSLRQTNIHSSPVVYQHCAAKYLEQVAWDDHFQQPGLHSVGPREIRHPHRTKNSNKSRKNLFHTPSHTMPAEPQKRKPEQIPKPQGIKHKNYGTTSTKQNKSQVAFEIPQLNKSNPNNNFDQLFWSLNLDPRPQAKPSIEKDVTEKFFDKTHQNVSLRQVLPSSAEAVVSDSEKRIKQLMASISSLLNSPEEERPCSFVDEKGHRGDFIDEYYELPSQKHAPTDCKDPKHIANNLSVQNTYIPGKISHAKTNATDVLFHPSILKKQPASKSNAKCKSKQHVQYLSESSRVVHQTVKNDAENYFLPLYASLPTPCTQSSIGNLVQKDKCDPLEQLLHCDVTSEDEEDLINSLSQDKSSKASHLATSLRLVRIYRNLKGQSQARRENLLLMSRVFQKWKCLVRHGSSTRNSELAKLRSAASFHKLSLISQHFYAWRFYLLKRKFQAQELYRLHLMAKGLSGLKWLVLKCHERDAWLKTNRDKRLLQTTFKQWKLKYDSRKKVKLQSSLQRWRSQLQQERKLNAFSATICQTILMKCFRVWKLEYENKQVTKMARHFWSIKLKQKVIRQWKEFSVKSTIHGNQNLMARHHLQHHAFLKFFMTWKASTQALIKAKSISQLKVMSVWFTRWRMSAKNRKANRRKQFAAGLQLRKTFLVKRCLVIWRIRLKLKTLSSTSDSRCLRWAFETWHKCYALADAKNGNADRCWRKHVLKHSFEAWKLHCDTKSRNRERAVQHIKRCLMIPVFASWTDYVQKKKLNNSKLATYVQELNQDICFNAFMTWRAAFNEKLLAIHWYQQWRDACVIQATRQWKRFVARRKFLRNHDKLIKQTCFNIWKQELQQSQEQNAKADRLSARIWNQRLRRMLQCWHTVCHDSKLIQPLVSKRERKTCARAFDAWRSWNTKVNITQESAVQLATWKMKQYFNQWKVQLSFERTLEMHKSAKMLFKMRKSFLIWKWRTSTVQRLKEKEQHCTSIVAVCFDRWRETAYSQKKINNDAVSWFRMVHDHETKRSAFKRWKWSLIHQRFASDVLASKNEILMKRAFGEWRSLARRHLQLQALEFADKLRRPSYHPSSPLSTSPAESPNGGSPSERRFFHDSGVELTKDSSSEVSSHFAPKRGARPSRDNTPSPCGAESRESFADSRADSVVSAFARGSGDGLSSDDEQSSAGTMTLDELDRDFDSATCFLAPALTSRTVIEKREELCRTDAELSDYRLADREVASFMRQGHVTGSMVSHCCAEKVATWVSRFVRSTDEVAAPIRRPILISDFIDLDGNRLTNIASFAVHRMEKPVLSLAFYQWKIFTRATRWTKTAQLLSDLHRSKTLLCDSFTMWKMHFSLAEKADMHFYRVTMSHALRVWLQWHRNKAARKRAKSVAVKWENRRLLTKALSIWRGKIEENREFEDALHALESEQTDTENLDMRAALLSNRREDVLMKRCFVVWRVRNKQLTLCDQHFQRKLLRRATECWRSYAEERRCQSVRVNAVHRLLFMYRFLACWRRKLHEKKMAELVCIDRGKRRLSRLLREWSRISQVRSWRRQAAGDFFTRSNESTIRTCLRTWNRRAKAHLSAEQFYNGVLLRKTFTGFKKFAPDKRKRMVNAEMLVERRERERVFDFFHLWKHSLQRSQKLKRVKHKKLENAWTTWRYRLLQRRSSALSRSTQAGISSHKTDLRKVIDRRAVLSEWRKVSLRRSELEGKGELIVIAQQALMKETAFNRWVECCVHSLEAKKLLRRTLLRRYFQAWRLFIEETD